ncbi:MAG TPA: pyridoxamine 5'-phosphate oxidase family protein, partial [Candidatus Krumholzibacterium sp.]|nr:pyridoxamine 5'-phosphate oxidase family protein [Candidatus Krumholzibacterium sp.]
REIEDPEECLAILREGKYTTIAQCRDGEPYVVTMNYGYDLERHSLFFHCAKTGHKLDIIARNPAVCATIVNDLGYVDGECEHKYQSLVIRGRMTVVEDLETKKRGIDILIEHQESDAGPVRERNLGSDADYDKFLMLEISIDDMTGKQSL